MESVSKPKRARNSSRGPGWSIGEDECLCRAWLDVTTSRIHASDQPKKERFWHSVILKWMEYLGEQEPSTRTEKSIKCRWTKLNSDCLKFIGAMAMSKKSLDGCSEKEIYSQATEIFKNSNEDVPFKTRHAWEILKDESIWITQARNGLQQEVYNDEKNENFDMLSQIGNIQEMFQMSDC